MHKGETMKTIEEVKNSINNGLTVNWKNVLHEVKHDPVSDKYYVVKMAVFKSGAEAFILNKCHINDCYIKNA